RLGAGRAAGELAAAGEGVPGAAVRAGVQQQIGGAWPVDAAALLAVGALEAVGDEDGVVAATAGLAVTVEGAAARARGRGVVVRVRAADAAVVGGGAAAALVVVGRVGRDDVGAAPVLAGVGAGVHQRALVRGRARLTELRLVVAGQRELGAAEGGHGVAEGD